MLSLLLCLLLADGNGVTILPMTSAGGAVTITVNAYPDGTFTFTGYAWGVPIIGWGLGKWDGDHFKLEACPIFADGDLLVRMGTPIPVKLVADIDPDDCEDGDPTDDQAGELDVRSQTGAGRGGITLRA